MKWRFSLIQIGVGLLAAAIWLRLAYWQVIAAPDLKQQAAGQRLTIVENPGERGKILGVDGQPFAANRANYLLFANPKAVSWNNSWQELQDILPASDSAHLLDKLSLQNLSWVALSENISPSNKELIEKMNLAGVGFEPRPVRFYPEGSASAQILGFVGKDDAGNPRGYFGLEGYYERQLAGRPGRDVFERDALGRPIVISGQDVFPSIDGQDIKTGLDRALQYMLAQKLDQGLQRYGASAGTITLMEPNTGQILAMVSLPNYDPQTYQAFDPSLYKNPQVAESYEPGSTFKVLIMAAALDTEVVKPAMECDICTGPVAVSNYLIRTWNDKYFPHSSMTDVIVHSDNIGMVFVSKKLGRDRMLDYLDRFGFGQTTGVDLQEESSPALRGKSDWTDVDLATAAFGQGIAVTPLQMLRAVGAIANGGRLTNPHIALTPLGKSSDKKVISPGTAQAVTEMMIKAVEDGEAKWAKPAGFTIAGKTGTAQIPVAGHYDKDKTIASFVGFAPAHDPKFVMLVTLREPQTSPWGSETAAPLWFDVARDLFRYWRIPPDKAG